MDEIALICPTQAVALTIIRDNYNDLFSNELRVKCNKESKESVLLSARSDNNRKSSVTSSDKFSNIGSDSYRSELSIYI